MALYQCSLRCFGACSCKPTPRGPTLISCTVTHTLYKSALMAHDLQLINRLGKPDTIIAQAADAILGKLYFYVIISSTINPKLKRPPIRIDERNLRLLTTVEKRWLHQTWRTPQTKDYVTKSIIFQKIIECQ